MGTDKPLISILMAVYEPRLDWLREQLESLNAQSYPNLRLYIRDDCSPTVTFQAIEALVRECVTAFSYTLQRNEANLGSNGTFELLTQEAEGDLFAYCDQDDVWLPEKLEVLEEAISAPNVTLSYCDMSVIDGEGRPVTDSLTQVRPRLRYLQGAGLAEQCFFRNCVAGCSMLLPAQLAKEGIPFPKGTVHDHWLVILAAIRGELHLVDRPLMAYRQHSNNQTGVLSGVSDKTSYRRTRVEPLEERLARYSAYARPSDKMQEFVTGRLQGRICAIWRNRKFSPYDAMAEIGMKFLPEGLFQKCLETGK